MDTSKLSGHFQIIVGICITMADDENITDILDEINVIKATIGQVFARSENNCFSVSTDVKFFQ